MQIGVKSMTSQSKYGVHANGNVVKGISHANGNSYVVLRNSLVFGRFLGRGRKVHYWENIWVEESSSFYATHYH